MGVSDRRRYNNFYSSLFHDLPEILTKDIIKPVKSSVSGLEDLIKHYEIKQVNEKLLPLIPTGWHKEMLYFIEDEFSDRIIENDCVKTFDGAMDFNDSKYNAVVDGSLTEICDKLYAYVEVSIALDYGIKSPVLIESKEILYKKYSNIKKNNLDFKQLFDYFY
jgi:putative hydrolase of HD superfamily